MLGVFDGLWKGRYALSPGELGAVGAAQASAMGAAPVTVGQGLRMAKRAKAVTFTEDELRDWSRFVGRPAVDGYAALVEHAERAGGRRLRA